VLVSLRTLSIVRIALLYLLCLLFVYTFVSCLFAIVVFGLPCISRIMLCAVRSRALLYTCKLLLRSLGLCAYTRTQLA
jgi:hypothetical protein